MPDNYYQLIEEYGSEINIPKELRHRCRELKRECEKECVYKFTGFVGYGSRKSVHFMLQMMMGNEQIGRKTHCDPKSQDQVRKNAIVFFKETCNKYPSTTPQGFIEQYKNKLGRSGKMQLLREYIALVQREQFVNYASKKQPLEWPEKCMSEVFKYLPEDLCIRMFREFDNETGCYDFKKPSDYAQYIILFLNPFILCCK